MSLCSKPLEKLILSGLGTNQFGTFNFGVNISFKIFKTFVSRNNLNYV
jgi:hypothetical protein